MALVSTFLAEAPMKSDISDQSRGYLVLGVHQFRGDKGSDAGAANVGLRNGLTAERSSAI